MELIVVGCSGSVPGPNSPASCYLVRAPHQDRIFTLALDCGPGSFGPLMSICDPREIDAFGLSHLHPDHCLDLCAFYVASRYSPTAPWPVKAVYGPAGTQSRISNAYEVSVALDPTDGIGAQFDFHDWLPRTRIGPFEVETVRVRHPVEAYAIKVTDTNPGGGSLVYSGDTGPGSRLDALAKDADLLLIEASFLEGPNQPVDLHLTGREAAEVGAAAHVGIVVLTHIPPWHDPQQVLAEATPHFAGPVQLAVPGGRWTIRPTESTRTREGK